MFALLLTPGCGQDATPAPKGDPAAFEKARQTSLENAKDPRFKEFKEQCDAYHATQARLRTLEELMSRRAASEAEIAEWQSLSLTQKSQQLALQAYMAQDGFSQSDRETMRWMMNSGN